MRSIARILILAMLLVTSALAIPVKVLTTNAKERTVILLLPMHSTRIHAQLALDEQKLRVEPGKFYEAEIVSGEFDTIKRNWLEIKPEKGPSIRFRVRRIEFLD